MQVKKETYSFYVLKNDAFPAFLKFSLVVFVFVGEEERSCQFNSLTFENNSTKNKNHCVQDFGFLLHVVFVSAANTTKDLRPTIFNINSLK